MSTEPNSAPAPTSPAAPSEPAVLATPAASTAPAPEKAKAGPAKMQRKWNVQQPKPMSKGLLIALVAAATVLVLIIGYFSAQMAIPNPEADVPRLDEEFTDPINSYSIRRPLGWKLDDPHDRSNIYMLGPREPGFSPVIIGSLDLSPGSLSSYVPLHKSRMEFQDKADNGESTIQWISEDMGESIDGCPRTARLEYESTVKLDKAGPVRVRTLQYIMEDKPRFYRVTCHVAANLYEKYLPKFEACVRSFKRQPLGKAHPSVILRE